MKKIYALMKGEKIIEKSEKYKELIPKREEEKGSYIVTWIGRVDLNNNCKDSEAEQIENLFGEIK